MRTWRRGRGSMCILREFGSRAGGAEGVVRSWSGRKGAGGNERRLNRGNEE